MTDIDTTVKALGAAAVVLGVAALFTRARVALVLLAGALFAALAILTVGVHDGWTNPIDASVWKWFYRHRFHELRIDADGVFAYIGRPVPFAVAGIVSGTLLALIARSPRPAFVVTGGVAVGVAVEETLKTTLTRQPADFAPLLEYAHSFPSGHVTAVGTLLGMIAACLGLGRSPITKTTLAVVAVTGVAFVAFLALYTRAHIFSDVVGGMVLSGAIVASGAAALRRRKPRAARHASQH